jgi:hypothetical protein
MEEQASLLVKVKTPMMKVTQNHAIHIGRKRSSKTQEALAS